MNLEKYIASIKPLNLSAMELLSERISNSNEETFFDVEMEIFYALENNIITEDECTVLLFKLDTKDYSKKIVEKIR